LVTVIISTVPRPGARWPGILSRRAATADLDIFIVGQLALAELTLDDALEAGPL